MRRIGGWLVLVGTLSVMGAALAPVSSARTAWAQELPPRPTLTPVQSEERDEDDPEPGRVAGTVIDLTTGAPTAGLSVTVGDRTLTTDANGNYDIGGLTPGSYAVALVLPEGRGVAAQGTVTVVLPAGGFVVQHLAFRSPAPAAPPPAPAPAASPQPAALPNTGGAESAPWFLALGLLLAGAGAALVRRGRRA